MVLRIVGVARPTWSQTAYMGGADDIKEGDMCEQWYVN